jgi:hypothetical protein
VHRGSLSDGDWIQLNGPFNLSNINSITYRVADTAAGRTAGSPLAAIEIHQDAIKPKEKVLQLTLSPTMFLKPKEKPMKSTWRPTIIVNPMKKRMLTTLSPTMLPKTLVNI